MRLDPGDEILTAYAERASGPGWSNAPIWVIVRSPNGEVRQECIQLPEQTAAMRALYGVSEECHKAMRAAIRSVLMKWRKEPVPAR